MHAQNAAQINIRATTFETETIAQIHIDIGLGRIHSLGFGFRTGCLDKTHIVIQLRCAGWRQINEGLINLDITFDREHAHTVKAQIRRTAEHHFAVRTRERTQLIHHHGGFHALSLPRTPADRAFDRQSTFDPFGLKLFKNNLRWLNAQTRHAVIKAYPFVHMIKTQILPRHHTLRCPRRERTANV